MTSIESRGAHESGEQWQHEGFRHVWASVRIITLDHVFLVYYDSLGQDPLPLLLYANGGGIYMEGSSLL
jgi:hypothetical protein